MPIGAFVDEREVGREDGELRQAPLLEVEDLTLGFPGSRAGKPVVDGLSLKINAGEVLALVGESGSGKSVTALALMQLLPPGTTITRGRIRFDGQDVLAMSSAQLDRLRGARIAMLFQQPHIMLDPTCRVGVQVAEPLRIHRRLGRGEARHRVLELLRDIGIPDPAVRARSFAHELSGGMAQRVMMAAALSANPELLIADEPTTALDVTVQAQLLKLLDHERRKRHLAILLITHDLSIVAALADRIAVMYAGRIVEDGPTGTVLQAPQHPYTQALVRCSLLQRNRDGSLFSLPGSVQAAQDLECGCRFLPRCTTAMARGVAEHCARAEPRLDACGGGCNVRCWAAAASSHAETPRS